MIFVLGSSVASFAPSVTKPVELPSPPIGLRKDDPDAYPQGTNIQVGELVYADIARRGDRDVFTFTGQSGYGYVANVIEGSLRDSFVRVYDETGVVVAESGEGKASWTARRTQAFYVDVWGSGTGTYQLRVTGEPNP